MKGISCDTGILNVTFCPLMEEHNTDEHDEEQGATRRYPDTTIEMRYTVISHNMYIRQCNVILFIT